MNADIKKRPLGKTGEQVTEISLGSLFVAGSQGTPHEEGLQVIKNALELGVNYIDTAPFYGNAQQLIGEALDGYQGEYLLGTKCGRWDYRTGPYRDSDAFKRQFEQTLRDLRRDSVDVLYIHEADWYVYWEDVETPREHPGIQLHKDYNFAQAPVIEFLEWAKENRLTRYIGISGNHAIALAKVLNAVQIDVDCVLVAFQYSLIWRNAAEHLIPLAKEKEVAVILGAPFQQGRLAVPVPDWLEHPPNWMDEDTRERFQQLYALQAESGITLAQLGLRYLLSDPDIACTIPGAANLTQLKENIACSIAGTLPDDLHQRIDQLGRIFDYPIY